MNSYYKFAPNVFLAKCDQEYKKGEVIVVTTKYGKENESVVFNLIFKRDGFYYYSIVRADGFNAQERARLKAERYETWASKAEHASDQALAHSRDMVKHVPMGQPILVGHHSEAGHRRLLDRSWNELGKSVMLGEKAESHSSKAEYWAKRADEINLSMPESLEFYEHRLELAKEYHEGLKSGKYEKRHSYSVTYAKKDVNELEEKLKLAERLWL